MGSDKSITKRRGRKPSRYYLRYCIALPWLLLFFLHVTRCPFSSPRTKGRRRIKSNPISLLHLLGKNHYQDLESRPVIYSFYRNEDYGDDVLSSIEKKLGEESVLRLWAELWAEAGWNPTLLTIDDAKKHPNFKKYDEQLKSSGVGEYKRLFYSRYLAMAAVGGGWFAKLNVLPLHRADENSDIHLPNGGGFTSQDQRDPTTFLSGNENEWNRMADALIKILKQDEFSSMQLLLGRKAYHMEDSVLPSNELSFIYFGPNLCQNTKEKRAVRYNYGEMKQKASDQLDYAVLAWLDARRTRCQSEGYSLPSLRQKKHFFADFKHIPFVMIIGAQKAATSLIFDILMKHPMIANDGSAKEKHYFNNAPQHVLTNPLARDNYRNLFSKPDGFHFAVDATPEYMMWTHILPEISLMSPSTKIIVSLRDPVDRLYSQYNMYVNSQKAQGSFEEFIQHDINLMHKVGLIRYNQKVANPDEAWKKFIGERKKLGLMTVARGLYSVQLKQWFRHYPRESFLILKYDDLKTHGENVMYDKITSFLGLPKHNLDYNHHIFQGNYDGVPAMKNTTRKMLYDLYKPFNDELSSLLGKEWDGVWKFEDK